MANAANKQYHLDQADALINEADKLASSSTVNASRIQAAATLALAHLEMAKTL